MAVAPRVPDGHKWCRRCGETKPAEAFATHTSRPDGRQVHCRACQAAEYRRKQMAAGKVVRPPDVPVGHKFCRGCQQVLPLTEWPRRARSTDGYAFRCRECIRAHDRDRALVAKYGLSAAEVEAMREAQGGVCAICRTAPAVHVDHDHATGKVRGMLCFNCNAALGHLRDDPMLFRRGLRYLAASRSPVPTTPVTSHRDEVAGRSCSATAPPPPSPGSWSSWCPLVDRPGWSRCSRPGSPSAAVARRPDGGGTRVVIAASRRHQHAHAPQVKGNRR